MLIISQLAEHVGEMMRVLCSAWLLKWASPPLMKSVVFLYLVETKIWSVIIKSYHLRNLFLFSPKFFLFLYDFDELREQLLPHSLQLSVPRSPTFRSFPALFFPTPALFCITPVSSLIIKVLCEQTRELTGDLHDFLDYV